MSKFTIQGFMNMENITTYTLSDNVDSWVVGFRNYYVSNLGHTQGLAKEENIDQIHSALAQFLYSPNGGKYKKNILKIAKKTTTLHF